MNLSSASTLIPKPGLLSSTDSSLNNSTGNFPDHSLTRQDNIFPSFKPPNSFLRNPPAGNFQVLDDDDDLVMFEPVKKTRVEDHNMNMLGGSNAISGQLPRDKGFRKTAEFQQNRLSNPLVHFEKPVFDDQKQVKDNNETNSTYNSNTSFSEHNAFRREIIDLEDDGVIIDKNLLGKDRSAENLLFPEDLLGNYNRTKDNLMQQLLLRNLLGQSSIPTPSPLADPQMALLAQLMQANQYNQLNQRSFVNPLANPLLQSQNPLMMSSLLYNMKLNNLNNLNSMARQPQFPFPGSDFSEPVSLQGKRNEPHNGFDNFNFPQPRPVETKNRTEVILLDDDEDDMDIKIPPVKTKINNHAFWTSTHRYERRQVFKIVKTAKKKIVVEKKKQVFTIIRYKPGQKPFRGFIGKKKAILDDDADSDERGYEGAEGLRRSSRRLRNARIEEDSAYRESMAIRALRERDFKPVIEDYVINVHVDENDENEEISETPIGDNFQVKLGPFCIDMDATRPVRQVWDPEEEDEEFIKSCIDKIESKFDKKTVGEEIILKTLKKFDMDVDKVIEELETNRMTFRSFFEVRQKVRRSSVLHHSYL